MDIGLYSGVGRWILYVCEGMGMGVCRYVWVWVYFYMGCLGVCGVGCSQVLHIV